MLAGGYDNHEHGFGNPVFYGYFADREEIQMCTLPRGGSGITIPITVQTTQFVRQEHKR